MRELLNEERQLMIVDASTHAIAMQTEQLRVTQHELTRPSLLHALKLARDGNQWCALYGDDLEVGIAGFGDSPELAMLDFDREWYKKIQ